MALQSEKRKSTTRTSWSLNQSLPKILSRYVPVLVSFLGDDEHASHRVEIHMKVSKVLTSCSSLLCHVASKQIDVLIFAFIVSTGLA